MGSQSNSYEYIIIGAGPAGVQAAYKLQQTNSSYTVLEAGPGPGTFFVKYPRHRQLISINKRFNYYPELDYNLRHDWNSLVSDDPEMRFTKYTDKLFPNADDLVRYLNDFVKKFNLNIRYNSRVQKIRKVAGNAGEEDTFVVTTEKGDTLQAKVVILAMGALKEKLPQIPGIELANTYSKHTLDQTAYENKVVAIIGGGNSAFETADHLAGHASMIRIFNEIPYKMAWDTHFPGDIRAINNNILDMFHLKSIHALRQAKPIKIEEICVDGKRKLKVTYVQHLPHWEPPVSAHLEDIFDEVIFCTGWTYILPEMFDDSCKPETSACGKYPIQTSNWESTNVKNLFFAGTVTQARDRKAASSFIHGFRYSACTLIHILNNLRNNIPLPMTTMHDINLQQFSNFLIKRVSTSSALYQLNYGVLCDVVIFRPKFGKGSMAISEDSVSRVDHKFEGTIEYYYELPSEWVFSQDRFSKEEHVWIVFMRDHKLSFGQKSALDFGLPPRLYEGDQPCQAFQQPVLRRFAQGQLVQEYALGGNFVVRLDEHQLPLDNNPTRCVNKVKNLVCQELGIGGSQFNEDMYSKEKYAAHFIPWTKEQIEEERKRREEEKKPVPCGYFLGESKWKRVGTDIIAEA